MWNCLFVDFFLHIFLTLYFVLFYYEEAIKLTQLQFHPEILIKMTIVLPVRKGSKRPLSHNDRPTVPT